MTDGKIDMEAYNKDLAHSINVQPRVSESNFERLFYRIDANDNKVARVIMIWSNAVVEFHVDAMPEKHLENFAKTLN